jgi:hypothetical protein
MPPKRRSKRKVQSGEGFIDAMKSIGRFGKKVYKGVKSANDWARKTKVISSVLKNPLVKMAGKSVFGVDSEKYGNQAEKMGYGKRKKRVGRGQGLAPHSQRKAPTLNYAVKY